MDDDEVIVLGLIGMGALTILGFIAWGFVSDPTAMLVGFVVAFAVIAALCLLLVAVWGLGTLIVRWLDRRQRA